MATIPAMTITFDDGSTVQVEPKMRDMVGAERAGHDYSAAGNVESMYATAYAALCRMGRQDLLPEGVVVPDSLDSFIDSADVAGEDDEDPEGKD